MGFRRAGEDGSPGGPMDTQTVFVHVEYEVLGVQMGHRVPKPTRVSESVPVGIESASDRQAPPVGTAELVSRLDFTKEALPTKRVEYRAWKGALVVEAPPLGDGTCGAEMLSSENAGRWADRYPVGNGRLVGVPEFSGVTFRRIVSSGREEAIAEAQRFAAACVVVDGRLCVPKAEPVWMVEPPMFASTTTHAILIEGDYAMGRRHERFRADRLDAALDHARFVAAPSGAAVRSTGRIDASLFRHLLRDDALDSMKDLAAVLPTYGYGDRFDKMPIAAIRAFADFREASERLLAGEDVLEECRQALVRLVDECRPGALPDGHPGRVSTGYVLSAFEGPARRVRDACDPYLAPVSDEDSVAFGSVVP